VEFPLPFGRTLDKAEEDIQVGLAGCVHGKPESLYILLQTTLPTTSPNLLYGTKIWIGPTPHPGSG